ncbi:MAG TPA: DegV family protein [Candidatus Flavonifractor intestinipullorum]|uniref:DegV family protein n=1 Tax=Candidatus Flavonifractor intestinipullorum TaxID=2838587 RepID=A0A9D2MBS0_9FIRM|nr:DegV family protein [Candidatus Flavonifractor intestinipullorum]
MNLSTVCRLWGENPEKIALLTDSCADLRPEYRDGKPIFMVPLKILCRDGEYADGVDISAADIYARLEAGELPKTSLPDGGSVEAVLDAIAAAGYEKVIALHLSGGLSGTCNLVRVVAQGREDLEVAVFDSISGSLGIGMMLLQIWEDIRGGMGFRELCERRVPHLIAHTHPFFSVDTLEYLQKGGRIGKITALAGTMLNIKPLVGFAPDGQLASVAKVRGRKAVQGKLVELLERYASRPGRYNLAVANGGAPEEMETLAGTVRERFPAYEHFWTGEIDATLSVYIGSGVLGAAIQFLD